MSAEPQFSATAAPILVLLVPEVGIVVALPSASACASMLPRAVTSTAPVVLTTAPLSMLAITSMSAMLRLIAAATVRLLPLFDASAWPCPVDADDGVAPLLVRAALWLCAWPACAPVWSLTFWLLLSSGAPVALAWLSVVEAEAPSAVTDTPPPVEVTSRSSCAVTSSSATVSAKEMPTAASVPFVSPFAMVVVSATWVALAVRSPPMVSASPSSNTAEVSFMATEMPSTGVAPVPPVDCAPPSTLVSIE